MVLKCSDWIVRNNDIIQQLRCFVIEQLIICLILTRLKGQPETSCVSGGVFGYTHSAHPVTSFLNTVGLCGDRMTEKLYYSCSVWLRSSSKLDQICYVMWLTAHNLTRCQENKNKKIIKSHGCAATDINPECILARGISLHDTIIRWVMLRVEYWEMRSQFFPGNFNMIHCVFLRKTVVGIWDSGSWACMFLWKSVSKPQLKNCQLKYCKSNFEILLLPLFKL